MTDFQSPGPTSGLEPHRGTLLIILAIVGFAVCFIASPVAFFMARSDKQKMEAGTMDPEGRSLTVAAYWLGLINSILITIGLCIGLSFGLLVPLFAMTADSPMPEDSQEIRSYESDWD
jgi:uncharacterized membrane protein YphA (DoxX/SURF4 family)